MTREDLIQRRQALTDALSDGPLNPDVVLERAKVYRMLGYPDLAVGDAYYALTLIETSIDSDFSNLRPECRDEEDDQPWPQREEDIPKAMVWVLGILIESLTELGCLQQALKYLAQLEHYECPRHEEIRQQIHQKAVQDITKRSRQLRPQISRVETLEDLERCRKTLPTAGLAPREVYPWDTFEPDRTSPESLATINAQLKLSGPDLEVRATVLPVLTQNDKHHSPETCIQLGLFARKDLPHPIASSPSAASSPPSAQLTPHCATSAPLRSRPSPH